MADSGPETGSDLGPGLTLSLYDDSRDRPLLLNWANASNTALWLTGRDEPVTTSDLESWRDDPGATHWVLSRDETPVGYGEIHWRDEEGYTQIMRLLVDPARRRGGLGRSLLRALILQARTQRPGQPIYARIAPGNRAALLMYPDAGLVPLDPLPLGFDPDAVWLTAIETPPTVPGGRLDGV